MKINARRYAYCYECEEQTVQTVREITIPRGRGCFRSHSPIEKYVCATCGEQQV